MLRKAILAILAAIVIAIAVICIAAAMQPADFKITRSVTINASADRVFEQVNDFHKWDAWSPWAKLDPAMKTTYSGPSAGVGSSYAWAGNSDVGEGKMTILESRPPEHIRIELEFISPFAAKNMTDFSFKPDGDKTHVTWSMVGTNNFVAKMFGLFINMDKLVGGDFEKGLAQMKTAVETAAK
ncbi:MAG: SRPBCC family protein [Pyrinomonadaceae bacterium]|nr:SRPBCC family protein [Pyrinomonadaceae bacterium]MBP6213730.1 SRPBCC family protein [Pyrinomonadaceae bacterium]